MSRFYFNNLRGPEQEEAPAPAPVQPVEQPAALSTFNVQIPGTLSIPIITQAGIHIYYFSESVTYPQLAEGIEKYGISYRGVTYALDTNDHLHITKNTDGTEQIQVIDQQNMNWAPIVETLEDITSLFTI